MNSGSSNLDALLLKYTNKKEREILESYAGGQGWRSWCAQRRRLRLP